MTEADENPWERIVTLTIPAAYIDGCRRGVVRELQSASDWYKIDDKNLSNALEDQHLEDAARVSRANRSEALRALRNYANILGQLPDDDTAPCVLTGEVGSLRHLLDTIGKLCANQIRGRFDYAPADIESLPPLLERLSWCVEQVTAIGVSWDGDPDV